MSQHHDESRGDISLDRAHVTLAIEEDREPTSGGDVERHQADDRLVVVQHPFDPPNEGRTRGHSDASPTEGAQPLGTID